MGFFFPFQLGPRAVWVFQDTENIYRVYLQLIPEVTGLTSCPYEVESVIYSFIEYLLCFGRNK